MRTIRTKVYQFNELNESAKQKAIEWYLSGEDFYFVWDDIKQDAKEIGLKIISIDDHRRNDGEFIQGAEHCADKILTEHGNTCETYKTAQQYLKERTELVSKYSDGINTNIVDEDNEYDFDNECDELDNEFLHNLLEDYRIMYDNNIDYHNSTESAIENITANEYEFTADGRRI